MIVIPPIAGAVRMQQEIFLPEQSPCNICFGKLWSEAVKY